MKAYVALPVIVQAELCTLGQYNDLRGWTMPEGEDRTAEGYMVVDASQPSNTDLHVGHVTWVPADKFEASNLILDAPSGLPPHLLRVVGEAAILELNRDKLHNFLSDETKFKLVPEPQITLMRQQSHLQYRLLDVLKERLK
ncbi:hypothetical protein SHAb15599_00116 [Acinetobacter phage SH-Ab 15599]|nr:hypothetical protein SHAb15599_00116 [Acinetobacter phage SH-Ab 15599]